MDKPSEHTKTGLEPIAKRISIEGKIDLRFANFEGLVSGVSANLSTSGMFIQSNHPEAAGTEFDFALRIEEWSPIQGRAKVVWIRSQTESPERPAGMGVQFVDLDAQSRRMIRWLVDKHLQDGGKLFDLDTVPAGASKYGGATPRGKDTSKKRSPRRSQGRSRPLRRTWVLGLLSVLIVAAVAVIAYWIWSEGRPGIGRLRPPFARQEDRPQMESTPESTEQTAAADAAPTEVPDAVTLDQVAGFIRTWTEAWEAGDADALLAFYADDFDASAYGGRQQWESEVRRIIGGSQHIRVAVSALEISFPTAQTARASFFRSLRSQVRDESGRLLLELETTDSGWKIRQEQALD